MRKITTHLWYDKEAKEAAEFYVSVFGEESKITSTAVLNDTPSGSVDVVNFEILGFPFMAISAGPMFKFNPAISFHIMCSTPEKVDELWGKLVDGGIPLMELGEYPFSKRYGWIQDKYGLSWQLIYTEQAQTESQKVIPVMMFVGDVCGKSEEAVNFYVLVFNREGETAQSEVRAIKHYEEGDGSEDPNNVKYSDFSLLGMKFGAMDSSLDHKFAFNEAISFIVNCENQEEIDYYWEKLSAVPEAEQCGWLKDKFGVSWQIVPTRMNELMEGGDQEKIARVTEAFLKMKKFDIAELEKAADGVE